MRLVLSGIGMVFLLSTAALAIGSIASLISIFFGFPVGWGIAIAIASFGFASNGWKGLTNLGIGIKGITKNAEGALGLLHVSAFVLLGLFYFSELTSELSAWWALLMPLLIIPSIAIQFMFEALLNALNPSGRRK